MDVPRGKGTEVESQLGVAEFRTEVGVRHPTHRTVYLAAIECDGLAYHYGISVRDRERIRRIWSTDWFRIPAAETERLLALLRSLMALPVPGASWAESQPAQWLARVDAQTQTLTTVTTTTPIASVASLSTQTDPPSTSPGPGDRGDPGDQGEPAERPEDLVFVGDDELEIEIESGDLVTYAAASAMDQPVRVRLTPSPDHPDLSLVAESTPLGSVLLGAAVGDTVVLGVPGKPPQPFVIQGIKRSTGGTVQ